MTPADPTACRFFGAAGGKMSRGVRQIGSDGSLSIVALPTGATLRTTKHCSLSGAAPSCENVVTSSGLTFSGFGAVTGTPTGSDPAAGTEYTLYNTPGTSSDVDAGGSHVTVTDVSSKVGGVFPRRATPGAASSGTGIRADGEPMWRLADTP